MPPKAPSKTTDTDWYKIELFHDAKETVLASLVLKPTQCYKLLTADPEKFQKTSKIGINDLRSEAKVYEKT